MSRNFLLKSVARVAAIGTVLAAAQLMAPTVNAAVVVAADPYPNSVATVTNLTLSRNIAPYGARTSAAVTVKPSGDVAGTPTGSVRLKIVGGDEWTAPLSGGKVVFTLPRRLAAQTTYGLKAFYLPPAGSQYKTSSDASFYTEFKVRTKARAAARAITRDVRPRVNVDVSSATGLNPGGRARVTLSRNGDVRRSTTVTLQKGEATVSFRKVRPRGTWSANVFYRGTTNFKRDSGADYRIDS